MTETLAPSVLIMAGGTGGHVFPALAAAASLQQRGVNVEWLGTRRGIESTLVPAANIPIHFIDVAGLRGKGFLSVLSGLVQLFGAIFQTGKIIARLKPVCVLGMGGFASGPGGLVAWLIRRPVVIHEQNAVAGTTNKLLAHFASKVLLGYPISLGANKSLYVGNPVRSVIAAIDAPERRLADRSGRFKLLVLGGSLGAKPINDLLSRTLLLIDAADRPEVWQQTGKIHLKSVEQQHQQLGLDIRTDAFIDDMAAAYEWSDLVLCRAGALTVAELTAAGVAALLVPLPYAIDDHQTENARWLADNNAGLMFKQADLSPELLVTTLNHYTHDREALLSMASAARKLAKIDAADRVAQVCLEVANV